MSNCDEIQNITVTHNKVLNVLVYVSIAARFDNVQQIEEQVSNWESEP